MYHAHFIEAVKYNKRNCFEGDLITLVEWRKVMFSVVGVILFDGSPYPMMHWNQWGRRPSTYRGGINQEGAPLSQEE